MKHLTSISQKASAKQEEQGIVMVLALMMGVVLIAGATGLVIRQMMAKKIGSYASYQQMADNAAANGFNRIIGMLNNPKRNLGYLYLLNNGQQIKPDNGGTSDDYLWEISNPDLDEYCTDTSDFPIHSSGTTWYWPTGRSKNDISPKISEPIILRSVDDEGKSITVLRTDNSRGIEPSFKLRSYKLINFDQNKGQGKGVFEVEGIIKRTSINGSKDQVSRALMTRYLDIYSTVDAPKNWAVLAGDRMNLGPTTIHGDGLVAWITNTAPQTCGDLMPSLKRVNSSATSEDPLVWPLNRGLPTAILFDGDGTQDIDSNNNNEKRIWSFDDRSTDLRADRGTTCLTVACTRTEATDTYTSPVITDQDETNNIIKIKHDEICTSSPNSNVCHIFVEHMHLSKTKIYIESTGSKNKIRRIVVHLALPDTKPVSIEEGGNIILKGEAQLCTSPSVSEEETSVCGENPEDLIIASSHAMNPEWYSISSCTDRTNTLSFEGNSLPSAWLAMAQGTVLLSGEATFNGVIWARTICGNGYKLDLYTTRDTEITSFSESSASAIKSASHVYNAAKAWDWKTIGFRGFGKTTIRGLRGDGLDTFQRF